MVISKGFSLITNAILDENKLQTLDDIKMAKKPKKRSISEPGPGKEDEGSKDSLSRSDDSDFLEKDEKIKGYGFVKVGIDIQHKMKGLMQIIRLVKCNQVQSYILLFSMFRMIAYGFNSRFRILEQ